MAYDGGVFSNNDSQSCLYDYEDCVFKYAPCQPEELHYDLRYTDTSAAWVLIASIIVFFMKAGFMLVEISFAKDAEQRRHVVVIKHQDAFASAFGFFFIGFDIISGYAPPQPISIHHVQGVTDPMLWFFKFTFASNAATIIGGCLVGNKYKLRLPAAFISAFVISGFIHPIIARLIWSGDCHTLSPYRFCEFPETHHESHSCGNDCTKDGLSERMYILDFAGGGAVHLVGGMAGLMLCLFAKFHAWRISRKEHNQGHAPLELSGAENPEQPHIKGFWDWMYPQSGGEEDVANAALGAIILWFAWFAFNCGSTESIELGRPIHLLKNNTEIYPFYGIPSVIAVNMIMSVASGGVVAVLIASFAQWLYKTPSINVNEIANGILSSLVAITAGCPFMDYWGACLTGVVAVILYHFGCFLEYKLGIKDTARVVPVHGVCGLWSLLAVAFFQIPGTVAECNLHASFEGLCYCQLRLPPLNYFERLLAQFIGVVMMVGISGVGMFLVYGALYFPLSWLLCRAWKCLCVSCCKICKKQGGLQQDESHQETESFRETLRKRLEESLEDSECRYNCLLTSDDAQMPHMAHVPPVRGEDGTGRQNGDQEDDTGTGDKDESLRSNSWSLISPQSRHSYGSTDRRPVHVEMHGPAPATGVINSDPADVAIM